MDIESRINEVAAKYNMIYSGPGFKFPDGVAVSITPSEGLAIYSKIKLLGLKVGYECGTGTGYSSLWLGSALDKLCSIDSYVEQVYGAQDADRSKDYINHDNTLMERIDAMNKDLGTTTQLFKGISPQDVPWIVDKFLKGNEKIDCVLIDGCHYKQHPLLDIQAVWPYLKKRCVIFWHDCTIGYIKEAIEYVELKGFKSQGLDINDSFGLLMQTRGIE